MIEDLPLEVISRIFVYLGFDDEVHLRGQMLWRNDNREAAMALALTCTTLRDVFARTVRSIEMNSRFRFGVGSDQQISALLAVCGQGLTRISLSDLKTVANATVCAAIRYCPNLRELHFKDLVGVPTEGLAQLVCARGSTLESLVLHSLYVGDDVLQNIADHCRTLRELRLKDLDNSVSPAALFHTLAALSSTIETLELSNLFGTGLCDKTLPLMSQDYSWPKLKHLEIRNLSWLSDQGLVEICRNLGKSKVDLSHLHISCRPERPGFPLAEEDIQSIKAEYPQFEKFDEWSYGFNNREVISRCVHELMSYSSSPHV